MRGRTARGGALVEWRPRFFDESALFDAIRDAAALFAGCAAFPSPEEIDEALSARARVRFARKDQRDRELYDTRIVRDGVVPTRAGSWHDLLNALVWATFPRTKAALHRRQARVVVPSAPRRTREGDALALVDEGGVFRRPDGAIAVFGHAIYEAFVLGRERPSAALLDVAGEGELDRAAAVVVGDPTRLEGPSELARLDLGALWKA